MSRPLLVFGLSAVSAILFFVLSLTHLDMETDQLELISTNHPLIALQEKLDPFNFEDQTTFTVVVEAPTPREAIDYVKAMVPRIREDRKNFRDVFYRIEPRQFRQWAFLYLEKDDLLKIRDALAENAPLIDGLARDPEVLAFFRLINREMSTRMVGELFTGFLDNPSPTEGSDGGGKPVDLAFLIQALEGLSGFLKGASPYVSPWGNFFHNGYRDLEQEGYFWEGDKRYLVFFVVPQKEEERFNNTQTAMDQLRRMIREARSEFPDVQAGVTGQEALNNDEMETALGDMNRATWFSLAGVWALMLVFLRSVRRSVAKMVSVCIGLAWTFGFAALSIGHLNILSLVFAPLLIGLGDDFGVHWYSRYEEEERNGSGNVGESIQRVMDRSGPAIVVAGLGISLSFLPFVLTGFRGLVELGIIAGVGILLILLATFVVLPTLTPILGGRLRPGTNSAPQEPGPRDLIRFSPTTARWVLLGVAAVSVLALVSGRRVGFDLNPLRLQSVRAESVIWEKRLVEGAQRSILSAAVFAHSPQEVLEKSRALEKLPSVSEVENVFSFLPLNQEEKVPLVRSVLADFPEIQTGQGTDDPADIPALVEVMERIRFKMRDENAAEWGAEDATLQQLARARSLTGQIIAELRTGNPEVLDRLKAYRGLFTRDLADQWQLLKETASVSPMEVKDLPRELRSKFLRDDLYVIRVYPRESVWDEGALGRFVQDLQSVDRQAVGDPVSLYVFAQAFKKACIDASLYAVLAICALLLFLFRHVGYTLLAWIPLAVGMLWTVGIMGWWGTDFNLANSIFMPLVVGAGVEYGIIILQRWREGKILPGHLPLSTGKGIILAALTTTVGFGSLMISDHQGIFSLGFVAAVGSLCVLVAAVVVVPAVLALMPRPDPSS